MLDVSVIIVNWNTREYLRNCLDSVFATVRQIEIEVIVVDNASSDDSVSVVEREFPQVKLIKNESNRGFAAANNQGMKAARGRYVLLLNSDTIVLDEALDATVRFADSEPQAAVVGCRVVNPDRTLQATGFMYPSLLNMVLSCTYLYKLFPRSRFFGRERMTWWDRDDVREVDVVTGCFMLVRREAIEQVGGMDEAFFMYGEETDWCYRFKQAGWKMLFAPAGQIIHYGGASSRQRRVEMAIQLRRSILLFIRKHQGRLAYVLARGLTALYFLLRIPYWLVRAGIRGKDRGTSLAAAHAYCIGAYKMLFDLRLDHRG